MSEDQRPPEDPDATRTAGEQSGSVHHIGNYRLLERVGEGGMGEVWLAEQEKPVRRRVALKLIKAGMDTRQVIARFESERQALALMNHPSIAKVFDAGTTPEGRPFFAMEYVKGEPITCYCDRHCLTTRERLELFMKVCAGVQHAHQKGIIHRDIKASNVLVAIQEEKPVPKIIDFGVAKATEHRLTEQTVYTQLGVLIGTPEYMSPEQAEMTGLDVDTRTDVYSLGVLLYELLTGVLPFDPKELRKSGFDEIRRKIREEEPFRPSTRVSTLDGETATSLSTTHRVELPTLRRQLKGDLDWITMKALEKDRTRRYGSANELAADIGRHLRHEPVEAGPPSASYRMGKFVRRHKVGVAAGVVVALAVVLGIAGTTVGFVRAKRAEGQARQEAETAERVSDFLVNLFEVSDPSEARGNTITAREILDKGAEKIELELGDQPLVRARLLHTIGSVYERLGLYDLAIALLESALAQRREALGNQHPATLGSMSALGWTCYQCGRLDRARELFRESHEGRTLVFGEDHPDTLWSLHYLGTIESRFQNFHEAERLLLKALERERRILGDEHYNTLGTINNLAQLYQTLGRYDEAERLHRENLETRRRVLGEDHPITVTSMHNLGFLYRTLGRYDEAELLLRETLKIQGRVLGEEHPDAFRSMRELVKLFRSQGRYDEALAYLEKAIEFGHDSAYLDRAEVLAYLNEDDEVVAAVGEGMKVDGQSADYYRSLAFPLFWLGRVDEAIEVLDRAIDMHPNDAAAHFNRAGISCYGNRPCDEIMADMKRGDELGGPTVNTYLYLAWLPNADLHVSCPEDYDAERALQMARKVDELLPENPIVQGTLGLALYRNGHFEEAWQALTTFFENIAESNESYGCLLFTMAMTEWKLGRETEARAYYDRGVTNVEATLPKSPLLLRFKQEATELLGVQP
jgi:tetratricopeptide (TPR) repeat protein